MTTILQRYAQWVPAGVSFLLALLFALTPFWYLILLAGIAGGWFTRKMRWGAISAAAGGALAWLLYILIQGRWILLEQVGGIIIGGEGKGTIIVIIIIILGGVLGALGGYIGSGIRLLVSPEISGSGR
jgi:hypothetical protein